MKMQMMSKSEARRLDVCLYSGELRDARSLGMDERMSMRRRLTKRYPNGFSVLVSSLKRSSEACSGYACRRAAAALVYAIRASGVGLLVTRRCMYEAVGDNHFGFLGVAWRSLAYARTMT